MGMAGLRIELREFRLRQWLGTRRVPPQTPGDAESKLLMQSRLLPRPGEGSSAQFRQDWIHCPYTVSIKVRSTRLKRMMPM